MSEAISKIVSKCGARIYALEVEKPTASPKRRKQIDDEIAALKRTMAQAQRTTISMESGGFTRAERYK
jgi:hypothetical protein